MCLHTEGQDYGIGWRPGKTTSGRPSRTGSALARALLLDRDVLHVRAPRSSPRRSASPGSTPAVPGSTTPESGSVPAPPRGRRRRGQRRRAGGAAGGAATRTRDDPRLLVLGRCLGSGSAAARRGLGLGLRLVGGLVATALATGGLHRGLDRASAGSLDLRVAPFAGLGRVRLGAPRLARPAGRPASVGLARRPRRPGSSSAGFSWRAIAATSFGDGAWLPPACRRRCRSPLPLSAPSPRRRGGRGDGCCGGPRPRRTSASGSTGWSLMTTPRPWQCSQFSLNASSRPVPIRLRVICTRPSEVTSATWWRVRSRPRHSTRRRTTRSRLDSRTMSMKSTTMMPPMSRSRSWRTISSAASRLFLVTVSSRLPPEPVNLPVLTSTTVIASVRSMISEPPEGSQTLRSRPLWICSSIR